MPDTGGVKPEEEERLYVLLAPLATRELHKPIWFARMTAIGPMTTDDPADRAEFTSEAEAMRCPAWSHPLAIFEVQEAGRSRGRVVA